MSLRTLSVSVCPAFAGHTILGISIRTVDHQNLRHGIYPSAIVLWERFAPEYCLWVPEGFLPLVVPSGSPERMPDCPTDGRPVGDRSAPAAYPAGTADQSGPAAAPAQKHHEPEQEVPREL